MGCNTQFRFEMKSPVLVEARDLGFRRPVAMKLLPLGYFVRTTNTRRSICICASLPSGYIGKLSP